MWGPAFLLPTFLCIPDSPGRKKWSKNLFAARKRGEWEGCVLWFTLVGQETTVVSQRGEGEIFPSPQKSLQRKKSQILLLLHMTNPSEITCQKFPAGLE